MWNTVILPILTSLSATGLGILLVWIFTTKRREDKISNEIAGIANKIEAVAAKMDNGFHRVALEVDSLKLEIASTKKEMQLANLDTALSQKEFYQSVIDRLQAETQKHADLRTRVDESIFDTKKQMNINTRTIQSILNMLEKLNDDLRKAENLP